jgi:chloramphenicol-sensitive protein RarD
LIAYLWWGLVPIYFQTLAESAGMAGNPSVEWALEILAHRIVWSIVLVAAITPFVAGGWRDLGRVLRSRGQVLILLLSAVLLAVNWLLYIYATVTGRVTEAGLGYYMMPLVNAFLATVFLKEKLRPAHYPALALVAVAVAIPAVTAGHFSWLAVAIPVTFGFYGLVRKKAPVESFAGLAVETLLLLPPSLAFLAWQAAHGGNHFGPNWVVDGWLMFSGIVTVVPLLTFTLSIRRLPLLAVSFIQFLSPTMQLLVAVFWIGESVAPAMWAAIGCVWAAVAIFIADAIVQARKTSFSRDAQRSAPRGSVIDDRQLTGQAARSAARRG